MQTVFIDVFVFGNGKLLEQLFSLFFFISNLPPIPALRLFATPFFLSSLLPFRERNQIRGRNRSSSMWGDQFVFIK